MLKLADLAVRPDICVGPLTISPARRFVQGPGGEIHLEPRVMQVFLLLLDSAGRVVTRNEIFDQCWGGAMVGDDNINRAIAAIRKIAADVAPGAFEVETIPRTGYRLVWAEPAPEPGGEAEAEIAGRAEGRGSLSRRQLALGGAAAIAVAGAGGMLWMALRTRPDPKFEALMTRGKEALRVDQPGSARYFEQAAAIRPRDAHVWGLLAYSLASGEDSGPRAVPGPIAQSADRAARTALAIDPNEPNALLTITLVQSDMLDWFSREERLRRILAIDPDNTFAMRSLGSLLHGVGRCRDALAISDRAISIEPLAPDHQLRRAMRLWVLGRVAEADQVIDRAMELWSSHRLVRMARLMIYAFTGRARAALAMVEDEETSPHLLSPAAASVWRASLAALENPALSTIVAARNANLEGSRGTPAVAAWAILVLSALGELDAAFEVANGFLLGRGSVIVRPRAESEVAPVNNPGWRNTFGLFTPPTKAMRLDPRFASLADGLGLADYWRRRGIGPDAFLFKA